MHFPWALFREGAVLVIIEMILWQLCSTEFLKRVFTGQYNSSIKYITKIIYRGRASCQVISVCYHPSPLVQGGLEIPVCVTTDMDIGDSNTQVLKKYDKLVVKHYKKSKNGTFDDGTASVMSGDEEDDESDSESGPEAEL